jgi:hypothetical protein
LAKLRTLHAEAALQATYKKFPGCGAQAEPSFMASLKSLYDRVNQFESFLERVA